MPISAEKLNHLNGYARTAEQISAAAMIYEPLDDVQRVKDMVRTVQDILERMNAAVEALLAPEA